MKLLNDSFFNEFTLELPKPAIGVVEALAKKRILGGVPVARLVPGTGDGEDLLLVAATELTTEAEMAALEAGLKGCSGMTAPNPPINQSPSRGNRGLQIEEPLIFEMDVPGRSGVDLPDVPKHKERLGGMKRKGCRGPAGPG